MVSETQPPSSAGRGIDSPLSALPFAISLVFLPAALLATQGGW